MRSGPGCRTCSPLAHSESGLSSGRFLFTLDPSARCGCANGIGAPHKPGEHLLSECPEVPQMQGDPCNRSGAMSGEVATQQIFVLAASYLNPRSARWETETISSPCDRRPSPSSRIFAATWDTSCRRRNFTSMVSFSASSTMADEDSLRRYVQRSDLLSDDPVHSEFLVRLRPVAIRPSRYPDSCEKAGAEPLVSSR